MTTILITNAVVSLLAAAGLGGVFARGRRRASRAKIRTLYVTRD